MSKAYQLAEREVGTVEWRDGSNPKVVAYFRDAGSPVTDDATAWCAAFVGAMLKRAGSKGTGSLLARSYLKWGRSVEIEDARIGDLVIFQRGNSNWQGHVAFYVRRVGPNIEVVGGNQSDSVSIWRYSAASLLGVRRDVEPIVQPIAQPMPAWLAAILAWFKK